MARVDLHVHTTASDGGLSPSEAVFHARELGLSAIAVTDHDTAAGVAEAAAAGRQAGVEVVPGIEISIDYRGYGIHLLGYFINPDSPAMQRLLELVIAERWRRNDCIIEKMRADGIPISRESLLHRFPDSVVGRPHFAAALVEQGLAATVQDAFARYLNRGCPYYEARRYIPVEDAFSVIREAGGKAVFAHPLQYRFSEAELEALTAFLTERGAVGMECLYTGYSPAQVRRLRTLAEHFGLCITGGSDFHGSGKPRNPMGQPEVPYGLLTALRER